MNGKLRKMVEARIRHWHGLATACQIARGSVWYTEARAFCTVLATEYDVPYVRVCGVVAALSPAVYWELNKRQAEALIQAHAEGQDLGDVVLSTYGAQAAKARAILTAPDLGPEPQETVRRMLGARAFKTWAFFDNLVHAASQDVTVDRHIVAACDLEGKFTQSAAWCYNLVRDAIRAVADELGCLPYELQAVVWVTYKETTGAYSNAEGPVADRPQADAAPF